MAEPFTPEQEARIRDIVREAALPAPHPYGPGPWAVAAPTAIPPPWAAVGRISQVMGQLTGAAAERVF